jgi:hypothetical protein
VQPYQHALAEQVHLKCTLVAALRLLLNEGCGHKSMVTFESALNCKQQAAYTAAHLATCLCCAVLCWCLVQAGHKHGVGKYTWNSGASYQGASCQLHTAIELQQCADGSGNKWG